MRSEPLVQCALALHPACFKSANTSKLLHKISATVGAVLCIFSWRTVSGGFQESRYTSLLLSSDSWIVLYLELEEGDLLTFVPSEETNFHQ